MTAANKTKCSFLLACSAGLKAAIVTALQRGALHIMQMHLVLLRKTLLNAFGFAAQNLLQYRRKAPILTKEIGASGPLFPNKL